MSEEIITQIVSIIAIILVFVIAAIRLAEPIAAFVYLFVKDSGEVVGDTVSNLVTLSAGVPGDVNIKYTKPSVDYRYEIDVNKKIIFVKASLSKDQEKSINKEKIEEYLNIINQEVYSDSGVEIKDVLKDKNTPFFSFLIIDKNDKEGVKLNIK